jgi:hypothetical protein
MLNARIHLFRFMFCWGTVLCLTTLASADQTYHGRSFGYNLTIPDGWEQINDQTVQQTWSRLMRRPSQAIADAGFQKTAPEPFTYPYAMVQVVPYPNGKQPNEKQIAQVISVMTGADMNKLMKEHGSAEAQKLMTSSAAAGPVTYDPATYSYQQTIANNILGIGPIRGKAHGHFGKSALVVVVAYDKSETYAQNEPQMQALGNSFHFDQASAYDTSRNGMTPARMGVVAGIVIAVIIVGRLVRRAAS